jgi:hypothetical protein
MQLARHQSTGKTTTTLATSIYTYANIGAKNGVLEVHLNNLTDATLPMLFLHRTNCTNIHVDSYCYHDFLKLGRILNNENEAVEIIEKSRDFFKETAAEREKKRRSPKKRNLMAFRN